jgi:threonine dehydrogenase-like Zn-dependent dehydrogenase
MKSWQITAKEKLELITGSESIIEGYAKVRVTRAGVCDTDIWQYKTQQKSYPIIPCRHATAVISEIAQNDLGLGKGDDVFLDPYIPCNECIFCKNEDYANCQNMKVYGIGGDGFLRDFVTMPLFSVKTLPENVNTEDAVFIDHIALALNVADSLNIHKGEHVIIVGADPLGVILAQLVMYYQAIPVILDDNLANLEIAKNSEIYYALSPSDKDCGKKINEITGGRLARYGIYLSGSKMPFNDLLKFIRRGGRVGISGFLSVETTADLKDALDKQLIIKCVKNGYGNIDSAINMLATKSIDLSAIKSAVYKFEEADNAFKTLAADSEKSIYHAIIDCIGDD